MNIRRLSIVAFVSFMAASSLQAQSLVELARKEKERRAALLKGKQLVVITNADLTKLKRKPALEIQGIPSENVEGTAPVRLQGRAGASRDAQEGSQASAPPPAGPSVPASADTQEPTLAGKKLQETRAELEARLSKAQEYVELLTLKMNNLWNQFYNMGDTRTRDIIQQQISETYEKLLKAQAEEVKTREELERIQPSARG